MNAVTGNGTTYAELSTQDRRLVIAAPVDALDWAEKDSTNPLVPIYLYAAASMYRRLVPHEAQGVQGREALAYVVEHYPGTTWATFANLDLQDENH